jgi:RimJ/RimL family protein N-acetyltransferase
MSNPPAPTGTFKLTGRLITSTRSEPQTCLTRPREVLVDEYESSVAHDAVRPATLHPFEDCDFVTVSAEVATDPLASRVLGFYAAEPSRWAALQQADRRTFWVDVDSSKRSGFIEVEVLEPGRRATFSLYIAARFRGRGYAPRALAALIAWTRSNTAATELTSDTEEKNVPSIRSLERVGFQLVGRSEGRLTFTFELNR